MEISGYILIQLPLHDCTRDALRRKTELCLLCSFSGDWLFTELCVTLLIFHCWVCLGCDFPRSKMFKTMCDQKSRSSSVSLLLTSRAPGCVATFPQVYLSDLELHLEKVAQNRCGQLRHCSRRNCSRSHCELVHAPKTAEQRLPWYD